LNQQQILNLVQILLTAVGGIFAARGYIKPEDVQTTVGVIMTAIGGVAAAAGVIWSIWSNTHKNTVAAAASLPKVQTIVMTDNATAKAVPSDKVIGPSGS
jgi:hypothetical protein